MNKKINLNDYMYWYNLRALEKEILENKFTDKKAFYYFLAFSILGVIESSFESDSETENYIQYLSSFIFLIITIWGCYSIFRANSNGDGKDFFKRFFALGWVVGFRLFIWLILVIFSFNLIYYLTSDLMVLKTNLSSHVLKDILILMLGAAFQIIFFILLRKSLVRVSNNMIPKQTHSSIT